MIRVPLVAALPILSLLLGLPPAVQAQQVNSGIASVADREIARRQELTRRADELIAKGDQKSAAKDYEAALADYKAAFEFLPDSASTSETRRAALDRFSSTAVRLAEQRIKEGRFADAKTLSEMVLEEGVNPGYRPAVSLLAKLEDPLYFNQTIGPKFVGTVEEVKQLLNQAQGFYDSGRYDLAMKRTDQVLNADPYNIAARRMQEKISNAKSEYGQDAYNEARARKLAEVDSKWSSPVRRYGPGKNPVFVTDKVDQAGTSRIVAKLNRIVIPQIQFRDATIREAIDFLKQKSRELDTAEPDANERGVNIVLKLEGSGVSSGSAAPAAAPAPVIPGLEAPVEPVAAAPAMGISPAEARITLQLSNIPLNEALKYVASLAGLKVKIEPYAVAIVPLSEPTDVLLTKEYRVSPGLITSAPAGDAGGAGMGSGVATPGVGGDSTGAGVALKRRADARTFLESSGVQFPPGSSAYFLASSSKLIVRNTQENLDLIDILVANDEASIPKQVEIESKFVEISQNNLKELSFDWLLGMANLPGSDRVFTAGGTDGNQRVTNPNDFPFVPPGSSTPVGTNPLTAANRSGSLAITANAIDSLLFGLTGQSNLAPGVFGISGVFSDPQFQVVIRALNQMKGVDLLSSPRITTKSGQRAVIEIIREFRYPTEFDPPQVPTEIGGNASSAIVVTPTTPTTFETRNTGVTLEVEPVVGADGYTIDLNLVPQVVEFEGFINYGSPILASTGTSSSILTENVINQPIFSSRKITTSVSVWDGQTVALGGLIREDVQKVNDKVPVLGDIPLLGRAFRSKVDQHIKRNLTIFVTARLIDPAGQPITSTEEEEEMVEATIVPESFTVAPPELGLPLPK
jgi:general secretion pathway protein D